MSSDNWTVPVDPSAGVVVRSDYITYALQNIQALFNGLVGDASADALMLHSHKSGTNAVIAALTPTLGRMALATDDPKCLWMGDGSAWVIVGGAVPHVRAYRNTNQSILNDVSTAISFSGERWDNDNMWVIGAPTRITIQHTGLYDIGGCVQWAANATGRRYLSIVANAATNLGGTQVDEASSGSEVIIQGYSNDYRLNAGDYIELMVRQVSTISLNIVSVGNYSPDMWATFLGP